VTYASTQAEQSETQIVKILGSSLNISQMVSLGSFNGTIDGEGTSIIYSGSASGEAFYINGGSVTFTNLQFNGTNTAVDLTRGTAIFDDDTVNATLVFAGGTGTLKDVTLTGALVVEDGATGNVEGSVVRGSISGPIGIENGDLSINGTWFDGGTLTLVKFDATVTNNLFTSSTGAQMITENGSTGTFEFNTFVNTGAAAPAPAINCESAFSLDSNIFVWGSSSPATGCSSTYSLFDTTATLPAGTGNISGTPSTFFASLASQDFHLATGSPAVGAGDPSSTITTDYDGNTRPNPAGSHPDIGAFESAQ
jgi:hypothetical protein